MSDDEADPELLELLRQSLGLGRKADPGPPKTHVLRDAYFISDNSIDVALNAANIKATAAMLLRDTQGPVHAADGAGLVIPIEETRSNPRHSQASTLVDGEEDGQTEDTEPEVLRRTSEETLVLEEGNPMGSSGGDTETQEPGAHPSAGPSNITPIVDPMGAKISDPTPPSPPAAEASSASLPNDAAEDSTIETAPSIIEPLADKRDETPSDNLETTPQSHLTTVSSPGIGEIGPRLPATEIEDPPWPSRNPSVNPEPEDDSSAPEPMTAPPDSPLYTRAFDSWSLHPLHPRPSSPEDEQALNFIFMLDLLNFSFYSDLTSPTPASRRRITAPPRAIITNGSAKISILQTEATPAAVVATNPWSLEYEGTRWDGYSGLLAAMHRAIAEHGAEVLRPSFWTDAITAPNTFWKFGFRTSPASSATELFPMVEERIVLLRTAGQIIMEQYEGRVSNLIKSCNNSAAELVNTLAAKMAGCFNDEHKYNGKKVRLLKRAQILVADLWCCFRGVGFGRFDDIDTLTAFADYRVPQVLHALGCMAYAPAIEARIRDGRQLESGGSWEVQLRGSAIWCVELIRREIERLRKEEAQAQQDEERESGRVNAVMIDFWLYDRCKALEWEEVEVIPHHRTRSIWY